MDVSELQSEKRTLNEAVQGLYKRLANREQIGRAEKEIASLEEKRIANNQKLADLEKSVPFVSLFWRTSVLLSEPRQPVFSRCAMNILIYLELTMQMCATA